MKKRKRKRQNTLVWELIQPATTYANITKQSSLFLLEKLVSNCWHDLHCKRLLLMTEGNIYVP